jgi:hypothetical protein
MGEIKGGSKESVAPSGLKISHCGLVVANQCIIRSTMF